MTREQGFSVVELLVSSAILCMVSGVVLTMLHDSLGATPVLEEGTDLLQRARVAADALAVELRAAAHGTPQGPLSRSFAVVEPRRPSDPPGSVSADVMTVRYVPPSGAAGRLAQPLAPGDAVVVLENTGCPVATTACGFVANTTAAIFDGAGQMNVVHIDGIGPGVLSVADASGARTISYPAGTEIAELAQVTFSFDGSTRQLRRAEGGGTFVVADNVNALAFQYFAEGMTPLAASQLGDGPFLGAGQTAFDADLLRVAVVRATVRVESGQDTMRGSDATVFARPGTATRRWTIPDVLQQIDVALRNRPGAGP